MSDEKEGVITTRQMILDLRNGACFVREKTLQPARIAELLDEAADEMEAWQHRPNTVADENPKRN